MQLGYYYRHEADQYSFIRIPKVMMTEDLFSAMSFQAKILNGLLQDRMGMAQKNNWIDEENRAYVVYQIAEIMTDMNISKQKAVKSLAELVDMGLVEKKQRGLGMPSLLYIKKFTVEQQVKEMELLEV